MNAVDRTLVSVGARLNWAESLDMRGLRLSCKEVALLMELADPQEGAEAHVRIIVRAVAHEAGLEVQAVLGPSTDERVARARNAACYLVSERLAMRPPTLGKILGRNAGTIRLYTERAARLVAVEDKNMTELIDRSRARL